MGMKAMQRTDEELDQLLEDLLRELKGLAVEQIAVMCRIACALEKMVDKE